MTIGNKVSGQVIKGYQLISLLGQGGFGIVYRAYQPLIDREVVIKAILPIYANDPNFIRRFEAEAQLIARLEHLHIVPLYDYWREPDSAYLVMRWLRGGSLLDSLKSGPWKVDAAARLLDQIAAALTVAHRNNVVHQDIKPANILLDEEGNAYLSDFGIAKNLISGVNLASAGDDTLHGSPAYIPPEQIYRTPITHKSDIYSLGLVLYELLTGVHPFAGAGIVDLLRHQANTALPALQTEISDLPEALNIVIWKSTAKDPDVRYSTALEMAEDFRQKLNSSLIRGQAKADSQLKPPQRTSKHSSTGVISLSSINLLAAAPRNPYKGLRAFQEADAEDFFGRSVLIDRLIQRLAETTQHTRFLAVIGASGSGKSSVVKAGLIPAIRQGRLPGWNNNFIVEMIPGVQPLKELEAAILKVAAKVDPILLEQLHHQSDGLLRIVNKTLPGDGSELLLVIDQFEEIFTLVDDEQLRQQFLSSLYCAVTAPDSRLRIIITLRADFYDRPLLYPDFGELVRVQTEVVLPLTTAELQQAVVAPATRAGLILEEGLVDKIVSDIAQQPSALPLLQYTLTELYERREKLKLTLNAYHASGGVFGALARRADELYREMSIHQQEASRQLFLRLVVLGEGAEDTRRRVPQSELYSLAMDKQVMQDVIHQFGQFRLLTFDHDPSTRTPTVEVAHEALIRSWERMRDWLNTSRDDLRTQRRLATATGEWMRANCDASFLATGARLVQFEALVHANTVALNQDEHTYVQTSITQRGRSVQRRKVVTAVLALISVIAVSLAVIAFDQSNKTEIARQDAVKSELTAVAERDRADQEANISRSRELAASALTTLDQVDRPLLLSLEALNVEDTFEARNSLLSALQSQQRLEAFLNGHSDWIRGVAYSSDALIAAASRDNTIRLWNAVTHQPVGQVLTGHTSWVNAVAFTPDGEILASASKDGTVRLWDVSTGQSLGNPLTGHQNEVWSVAFSPDGKLLASGSADMTVRLWDVDTGQSIGDPLLGHEAVIYDIAFSADGETLASGSADTTIRLWNMSDPDQIDSRTLIGHVNWVMALAFSADGSVLASGGADTTIRLWDVGSGEQVGAPLRGHSDWVRSLEFAPSGQTLASGGADGLILLWNITNGQAIDGMINLQRQAVWGLAFSPDGSHLVSGGAANALHLWKLENRAVLAEPLTGHQEQVLSLAYDSWDSVIASAGGLDHDYDIRLWNTTDQSLLGVLNGHTDSVAGLALSPAFLASGSLDRTVRLWDIKNQQLLKTLEIGDSVFAVAASPDGQMLAVGHNAGEITLWDASGDSLRDALRGHADRLLSLAFSPDSNLLASGSRDGTIRFWDAHTGEPSGEPITASSDGVLSVAFSPDGSILASGSRDTTIRLWDVSTGQALGDPLIGHDNWVMSVVFSPNGRLLASGGGDAKVILWDVAMRRPIGQPFTGHSDWVNTLAFSPDGNNLISGGRDSQVLIWSTGLDAWREQACQIANRNLNAEEVQLYFQGVSVSSTCLDL